MIQAFLVSHADLYITDILSNINKNLSDSNIGIVPNISSKDLSFVIPSITAYQSVKDNGSLVAVIVVHIILCSERVKCNNPSFRPNNIASIINIRAHLTIQKL